MLLNTILPRYALPIRTQNRQLILNNQQTDYKCWLQEAVLERVVIFGVMASFALCVLFVTVLVSYIVSFIGILSII